MNDRELTLPACVVRDWRVEDAPALARAANDRRIWLNMRDLFPHPYALAHAEAFIAHAIAVRPRTHLALTVDGEAAGGVGYTMHTDVERIGAEIGYWLAPAHWGRGIMSAAVRAVTEFIFREHPEIRRVWAVPFAHNAASARVLEKAGYVLEGRMRQSALKDGAVQDQLLYAIVRDSVR